MRSTDLHSSRSNQAWKRGALNGLSVISLPPECPPNTADQLRSGAPVRLAGGGTGRHLSLQYGCRPELRQLLRNELSREEFALSPARAPATGEWLHSAK